jgi:GGDEF domain-containing protein
MVLEGMIGRALMDPTTGLPNVPYFRIVKDWEERRAQRRNYAVRVVRISIEGGEDRVRRLVGWRLCRDLRSSDLIASEGLGHYRVLLTSPDAENVQAICQRIEELIVELNETHPGPDPLQATVSIDDANIVTDRGPCEPCEPDSSGEIPNLDSESLRREEND